MKRGWRLGTAAVLTGVVVLGAGGCKQVTKLSLLKEVAEHVSEAESYAMNMGMELDAGGSTAGITVDMSVGMDMDMEVNQNPQIVHSTGNMTVEVLGQSQEIPMENYSLMEDGQMVVYSNTDGEWTRETAGDYSQFLGAVGADEYLAMAESVELEKETETVDGQECYVLAGTVQGELLESMTGSMMESFEESGVLGEMDWEAAEIPIKVYITKKDSYPAQISMDMESIMEEALKAAASESGVEFSCDICTMNIRFSSFNQVGTITLPDEIRLGDDAV